MTPIASAFTSTVLLYVMLCSGASMQASIALGVAQVVDTLSRSMTN